jgi:repressor LexA
MQNKSLIKSNTLEFINHRGISKYLFYKETGITRGVLDKNNGMSEENIARIIAQYPEINIEWLITGRGEMFKNSAHIAPSESAKITGYPLVTQDAVAGLGNGKFLISDGDVIDYYNIPKYKNIRIDFLTEVCGSSMYPKYNSGDIIACKIIDEKKFIQWNKCHVIVTKDQGILIKRVRKNDDPDTILAVSDNKNYEPFVIPINEINSIALVVGVIKLE